MTSTPSLFEFKPVIKWQKQIIKDVFYEYDYSLGTHLALCSGSLGSAKSLTAAHIALRHCMENDNARLLLGRKALPDLKDTIYNKIVEHLDDSNLKEGKDYFLTDNIAKIKFRNGSEIISRSWSDRKYKKLGSLELSAAIIEELAENDDEDEKALDFISMRVGRLPHINQSFIIALTNPDEPDHWIYRRLIEKQSPTVHVYYSKLSDNPFLGPEYENNLRSSLDPMMARRMLDGEWLSIVGEGVYYAYSDKNRIRKKYEIDPRHPILLSWDFNIGEGKPLSVVMLQIINGIAHVFGQVIVHGMRTEESCDELAAMGILDQDLRFEIHGDASGRHSDTRNKLSDWDIIKKFMSNYQTKKGNALRFTMEVPRSNPPIRERHNLVNAHCVNANGEIRLFVYDGAETVDQGLRMTKLKKGGQLVEDDSKEYQHCTTALGYALHRKKTYVAPQAPQFL